LRSTDWLLDNIYARLSHEARRKIAAIFTASAYADDPHEVPAEAIASPRTLAAIQKDGLKSVIDPLLESPPPWQEIEGLAELAAILNAQAPRFTQVVAEQIEAAFPEPPSEIFEDPLIRESREFDPHKVRKYIYKFRREYGGYVRRLGHGSLQEFYGWLDRHKIEVANVLKGFAPEIQDALFAPELHAEYSEPMSARRMAVAFDHGYFAQDQLRVKFYYFLTSQKLSLPPLKRFLSVPPTIRKLLKDASKHET